MMEQCYILHFELLTVTFRQHTCVGEWKPATPKQREHLVKLLIHWTYMWNKYVCNVTVWTQAMNNPSLTSCSSHSLHSASHRGPQALAG